ncbi:MAG: peptide ABC transporter substrate-binding protein [Treponema sp.]|nr:peptide ABC transporter substrate-binding protein [Treponema sp.]
MKKLFLTLLGLSLITLAVSAGGGSQAKASGPVPTRANTISICVGSEPNTIDPALNSAVDGAIYLQHLFEGLYKYQDSGKSAFPGLNGSTTGPGMAISAPKKTVNADGTVTLVYTLRSGLKWSDGSPLTADDIVYTWQRLVDPNTAADYNYMLDMVQNANAIMDGTMDKSTLGIKAVNATTLEINLTYDCPYFDEIMCFPATFPVKKTTIDKAGDQWTFSPDTYISNGPYRMKEWVHNSYILVEKNPYYYGQVSGPDFIRFVLMDDENAMLTGFRSGDIDFIENFPADEIPSLLSSGELKVADYLGTYYVDMNNQQAPFNNPDVRRAFTLAIDRNFIVNQVTRRGEKPAGGFVPSGMSDATVGSDFRKIGGDYYSLAPADYAKNVAEAKQLMAKAGYPDGKGFPVVEYVYNTNDNHRAVAEALQNMWLTNLGVNVTLSNMDWAVFLDIRKKGQYIMARDGWIGDYNDPMGFLDMFLTGGGNNNSQYANKDYDDIIAKAKATAVQADRMKYMHQAEDMLVGRDMSMAPLYFYTQPYMLSDRAKNSFYTALGYFFFFNTKIAN